MIKDLFDTKLMDSTFLDEELLRNFQIGYKGLESLYESKGQEMPMEFQEFRDRMYELWERKQSVPTEQLIKQVQLGDDWFRSHEVSKEYADNMMLYISYIQELKFRGISEKEALLKKPKKKMSFDEIFGDRVDLIN